MRLRSIVSVALGGLVWTLAEYGTHRMAMHAPRNSSPLARDHLDHHGDPDWTVALRPDLHNLGFKSGAFALSTIVVSVPFAVGFTAGYATYTYLHDRIHHRAPETALARRVWTAHYRHHFEAPQRNFGVTSSLWDGMFRTGASSDEPVQIPASRAPEWLVAADPYAYSELSIRSSG